MASQYPVHLLIDRTDQTDHISFGLLMMYIVCNCTVIIFFKIKIRKMYKIEQEQII